MEWTNRGDGSPSATQPAASSSAQAGKHRGNKGNLFSKLYQFGTIALLFSGTILIISVLAYMARGGNTNGESKNVNTKQMQAVFLNGGQVYFGHINALNDKFMRVADIYYLRVNQQVQPDAKSGQQAQNDISLVKLGCELHGPTDSMVINQSQVIFWENLKDDGQVAKAVADYKKQNPNGQKCDAAAPASGSNSSSTTPTTTTPSTTPTTNTTTKKP